MILYVRSTIKLEKLFNAINSYTRVWITRTHLAHPFTLLSFCKANVNFIDSYVLIHTGCPTRIVLLYISQCDKSVTSPRSVYLFRFSRSHLQFFI